MHGQGPAGYGRYDDEPRVVGCPWARTNRSPCIARDGDQALHNVADPDATCRGCERTPEDAMQDLAAEYPPAAELAQSLVEPGAIANEFALLVREATEPGGGGGTR